MKFERRTSKHLQEQAAVCQGKSIVVVIYDTRWTSGVLRPYLPGESNWSSSSILREIALNKKTC